MTLEYPEAERLDLVEDLHVPMTKAALVAFVQDPDGGQGLTAAVDLLSDTLLSHLSYEERELVEPLARLGVL